MNFDLSHLPKRRSFIAIAPWMAITVLIGGWIGSLTKNIIATGLNGTAAWMLRRLYRKFVKEGLIDPIDPIIDRLRDWFDGGEDFLERVLSMAESDDPTSHRRRFRRLNPVSVEEIISVTASQFSVSPVNYVAFRSGAAGRDLAAFLCRRYTRATLRELSERFGLRHPDSASDLIRRGAKRLENSREVARQITAIEIKLKTNPKSDPSEAHTKRKSIPERKSRAEQYCHLPLFFFCRNDQFARSELATIFSVSPPQKSTCLQQTCQLQRAARLQM